MAFREYDDFDGLGLAELVRKGEVSAVELTQEALSRIERADRDIGAVVRTHADDALRAASSVDRSLPFAGVPFLLKDLLLAMAGKPLESGTALMRGYVATEDAELTRRYREAGLIFVGQTRTPEFGILPTTEPLSHGPARNPWGLEYTTGGSSGGSAAAVAAGYVPIASAGDGGGSIRIPASCCGLFGIKPSRGRTPSGPEVHGWAGCVVQHVVTRSVRDSAALLDTTAGPEPGGPYSAPPPERPFAEEVGRDPGRLRVGLARDPFLPGTLDAESERALDDAAALVAGLGHDVVPVQPEVDAQAFASAFLTMIAGEISATIGAAEATMGRRARRSDLEPTTRLLRVLSQSISGADYAAALRTLYNQGRAAALSLESFDVVLSPVLALPPQKLGFLEPTRAEALLQRVIDRGRGIGLARLFTRLGGPEKIAETAYSFAPYTMVFNVTGQPSMSVPLHWTDVGLPIGSLFTARMGDEATLFRLAAQLESERPWFRRRPPHHAGRSDT